MFSNGASKKMRHCFFLSKNVGKCEENCQIVFQKARFIII